MQTEEESERLRWYTSGPYSCGNVVHNHSHCHLPTVQIGEGTRKPNMEDPFEPIGILRLEVFHTIVAEYIRQCQPR